MKKLLAAALVLCAASAARAETAVGTMTVYGTVASTITVKINSAGILLSGSGSSNTAFALGQVSRFGMTPYGFTKTLNNGSWMLSSSFSLEVDKANLNSNDYTLSAQLVSPVTAGINWNLNGVTVSDAAPTVLTSAGQYGTASNYNLDIVVSDAANASAIDNTINFVATSN